MYIYIYMYMYIYIYIYMIMYIYIYICSYLLKCVDIFVSIEHVEGSGRQWPSTR